MKGYKQECVMFPWLPIIYYGQIGEEGDWESDGKVTGSENDYRGSRVGGESNVFLLMTLLW